MVLTLLPGVIIEVMLSESASSGRCGARYDEYGNGNGNVSPRPPGGQSMNRGFAPAPPQSLPPMRNNPLPALGLGRPVEAPGGDEEQGGGGNAFAGIVGQRSLLARMQKNSRPGGSAGYT